MDKTSLRHIALKGILAMMLAAMVAACTGADVAPTEPDAAPPAAVGTRPILFGGWSSEGSGWRNGRSFSRDDDDGELESDTPDNIGVFAFGDGANTTYIFRNQKVLWSEGKEYTDDPFDWEFDENPVKYWPYTTEPGTSTQRPWEEMRYRFFAYSPWHPSEDVNVTAENYAGFNTFAWDNIPGFTSKDYVLCNDICDVDNRNGDFTSMNPVIHFSMRHILSRIRFFFRTTVGYHQIRRIELNSLTILSAGKIKSATFNFKDDAWDEIVHWSNEQPGNAEPVELKNLNNLHYYIPVEYPEEPFTSVYVYPQEDFSSVKLQMDYTVYDSEGIPTRVSKLVNSVNLPNWDLLAGYYYDIKIIVSPTYLYVLSDNDQDFDGYVIIKDSLQNPTE